MAIDLDSLEQRIVGVLIEKELTVPDAYPLTPNALLAGCNQKSNRDPVLQVEDFDIEGALRALMDKGWVTRREAHGSRVMRYAHEARSQLGVEVPALAILSELLCRGPQAPGALKTRCSRMRPFASPAEVEAVLDEMAARPVPYVRLLPRAPRERHARWCHLLGRASDPRDAPPSSVLAPASPTTGLPPPRTPRMPSSPLAAEDVNLEDVNLEGRVEELEQQVADLTDRLDRLAAR